VPRSFVASAQPPATSRPAIWPRHSARHPQLVPHPLASAWNLHPPEFKAALLATASYPLNTERYQVAARRAVVTRRVTVSVCRSSSAPKRRANWATRRPSRTFVTTVSAVTDSVDAHGTCTETTVRICSSPRKSPGFVVNSGSRFAAATLAIIKSAIRRRGFRPIAITSATITPY
jgi:hypothetical protein